MDSFNALMPVDWLLLVYLAVIIPVWGLVDQRRASKNRKLGIPRDRMRRYNRLFVELWVPTIILLVSWFMAGRDWHGLGFGFEQSTLAFVGYGVTLTAIIYLFWTTWQVKHSEKARTVIREQLDGAEALHELMPGTRAEFQRFRLVAITAGITEEILYRGFLFWVLSPVVGVALAAGLTVIIFTLGHLYQERPREIFRVAITGAILIALYISTGSLIAPIILHIIIDWTSNDMVWAAKS